jgi:hypothetical protein
MRGATVVLVVAAVAAVAGRGEAQPAGAPTSPARTVKAQDLTDTEMEAFLAEGEVVRSRQLSAGVTRSLRVTLLHAGVEHDAHIQSVDQDRPLGTLRGGSEIDFRDSYRHNIAAYRLDRLLGLGMVPVTVLRRHERKKSAFTWWVDDVAMTETERRDKNVTSPDAEAWNRQMAAVRIFDQLIYNFDRNLGNLLIDEEWRIWMIDHTRAFKIFREVKDPVNLRFRCPRGLLDGLRRLDRPTVEAAMAGLLTSGQLNGLFGRRDAIVRHFEAQLAARGEAEVLYDLPSRIKARPARP